ncbi:MAG: purine-cytosine permease family protein [Candidatus Dormibacteria bacterium]
MSAAVDVAETSEAYVPFQLEQRGIDLIPDSDRKMGPWGLFWLWSGAVWNVEFLFYGALICSFGLSLWQAVAAILIGNIVYAFLGFASLAGPATGTTAFMVSRAPFGRNGNRAPSFFNWLTQVGFEVLGLVLVVLVVIAMLNKAGVSNVGTAVKVVIIICAVVVQFIVPFLGHATIKTVLRYLSFVFIAIFVIMAILVLPNVHWNGLQTGTTWWLWTTALVLIVSTGGLGWTENAADYSRYLPKDTSKAKTFWSATLGAAIPSILLELLGVAAYLVSTNVGSTEVIGIPSAFAAHADWFFWPFMIVAIFQLFAINTIDMYSSGVTLQAIGIPVKRWGCILIDTIVSGVVTGLVIFQGKVGTDLSEFLDYIVVWLGAWFAIMAVDYLLRRGSYDRASLTAHRGGLYWRDGGFNWKALLALAAGMFAAMMWIDALYYYPAYQGPISSATGGGDLSWLIGIVVAGVLYYLLSFRSIPREVPVAVVVPAAPVVAPVAPEATS